MKWKYLLLIPVIILVLGAFYNREIMRDFNAALLSEKYISIQHSIDMLGVGDNIVRAVEYLDRLPQVYAEVYKNYELISKRTYETSIFTPFAYPEFLTAIETQESGYLVIDYIPDDQTQRGLHIYFRWIGEYLVVAGVSQYSIVTDIPVMVSVGLWGNMAITFILNTWLIILFKRGNRNGFR